MMKQETRGLMLQDVIISSEESNNLWWMNAECAGEDVELFFPDRYTPERDVRVAKNICKDCMVQSECLMMALETESLGIWAGTDEKDRSRMRVGAKR